MERFRRPGSMQPNRRSAPAGGKALHRMREEGRIRWNRDRAIERALIARGVTGINNPAAVVLQSIWEAVWARDKGECARCGETGELKDSYRQLDFYYIILPQQGGRDSVENLRVLCQHCGQVVASEARQTSSDAGQFRRIVPPRVDQRLTEYEAPLHHVIGKMVWICSVIASIVIALAIGLYEQDLGYAYAIIFSLLIVVGGGVGTFVIFPIIFGLSGVYDRFFNPEKGRADAAYEDWQKQKNAWQLERQMQVRAWQQEQVFSAIPEVARSRYVPAYVKQAVWARDGGHCVACGSSVDLQYDHDIPFSRGGANSVENIRLLCEDCNRKKSDKII